MIFIISQNEKKNKWHCAGASVWQGFKNLLFKLYTHSQVVTFLTSIDHSLITEVLSQKNIHKEYQKCIWKCIRNLRVRFLIIMPFQFLSGLDASIADEWWQLTDVIHKNVHRIKI